MPTENLINTTTTVRVLLINANNQEQFLGNVTFRPGERMKEFYVPFHTISFGNKIKLKRINGELSNDAYSNTFRVVDLSAQQETPGVI